MSTTSTDIETAKRSKEYLEGFADFSHYIASDDSLPIYRRFGSLGSRNILYLQAELQFLEQHLDELDDADRELIQGNSGDEKKLLDELTVNDNRRDNTSSQSNPRSRITFEWYAHRIHELVLDPNTLSRK
jgi:hypothetical protein